MSFQSRMFNLMVLVLVASIFDGSSEICAQNVFFNGSKVLAAPNPNNTADIVTLLRNKSVAENIGVSATQLKAIQRLLDEVHSTLNVVKRDYSDKRPETIRQEEAIAAKVNNAIEEILQPSMLDRLRQVAFQVEVKREGLRHAVAQGWLGKELDIDAVQLESLLGILDAIETKQSQKISEVQAASQEEFFSGLTPEQSAKARAALGKPFDFRDDFYIHRYGGDSSVSLSAIKGVLTSIGNPNRVESNATLLRNHSVRKEIGLTENEWQAINSLLLSNHNDLGVVSIRVEGEERTPPDLAQQIADKKASILSTIEEVLTPDNQKRLREIHFQIEVARVGLGIAATEGRLGKEIGVYDNQKDGLLRLARKIEAKQNEAICALLAATYEELYFNLKPEQRDVARSAIGAPFVYIDDAFEAMRGNVFTSLSGK